MSFQFDQFHQIFDDHIAIELFTFFFCQRAVAVSTDKFVGSFDHFRGRVEGEDLFRCWVIRQKSSNFGRSLCFKNYKSTVLSSKNKDLFTYMAAL